MAEVTYLATVTFQPPCSGSLITNSGSSPFISATANTLPLGFTLQQDVPAGQTTAIIAATLVQANGLPESLAGITPTFTTFCCASNNYASPTTFLARGALVVQSNSVVESSSSSSTQATSSTASSTASSTSAATANTEPAATSTTTSANKNAHKDTGAIVGAAIGCFLAGCLIVAIALLFFFRRRSRRSRLGPEKEGAKSVEDASSVSMIGDTAPAKIWDRNLAQSDSDKDIASLVSRSLDEIELFVDEFCVKQRSPNATERTTSDLAAFQMHNPRQSVTNVLQSSPNPDVIIKHCIAGYLIQKIDPTTHDSDTLLPKEYVLPSTTIGSESGRFNMTMYHAALTRSKDSRQALTRLRVLMANTRLNPAHDQQFVLRREQVITDFTKKINTAFEPWLRGDGKQRSSALRGIILHVSELGVKLYSQPCCFVWRWDNEAEINADSREIVVLPGLEKITDQQANMLATPIQLVKPRRGSYMGS